MPSQTSSRSTSESIDLSEFKSPVRRLARSFKQSRDNWKQKHMEVQAIVKREKNRAAAAVRSREHWKSKAKLRAQEKRRLERELAQVRRETADALKKNG